MNLVRQWIGSFPEAEREAVSRAFESASLPKIRRALHLLDALDSKERGPVFDVELLSTQNLEPILPVLQLAFSCLPTRANVRLAPLDDIEGHISRPTGATLDGIGARVLIWRAEEVLPEGFYPVSHGFPERLNRRVELILERIDRIVSLHGRNAAGVPLFLSTIAAPVHLSNPVFAAQHATGVFASLGRINQRIYEVATRTAGIHVLDLAWWAALEGMAQFDATLDFLARQPLSAKGQLSFALFIARSLRPLIVPRRKVLALDLDNTLWSGVVGEDGVQGLKLGHDFPGNVHLRIQRELLELRNRGVLLAIVSKNNEADAREAFESLPDMLIRWDDFAIRKIDWNHKHENLRAAARELGLGLDSFVFLDDADYEREQMRQLVPEVLVLNNSPDPMHILRALWETDAFDSLSITEEDRRRHQDYAVRSARNVERADDDLEGFLKSLEMEATIEEVGALNLERVVTMLGKTNQFNLTTRRHSREQVQAILDSPGSIALTLRLRDKFGDQGIIAVLLAISNEPSVMRVDSFLVSCRALGRGVEDALWAAMINRANRQGIRRVEADYIATAKNSLVSDLYERLGLTRIEEDGLSARYALEPVLPIGPPLWIKPRGATGE